jgi:hypothetical protein
VWLKHQEHPVEASIFRELPNALRMAVGVTVAKSLVRSVRVFQGLSEDALELISSRIMPVEVPPGGAAGLQGCGPVCTAAQRTKLPALLSWCC